MLVYLMFPIVSAFRHRAHGVNSQLSFCQWSIKIHSEKSENSTHQYEKQCILFLRTKVQ